MGIIRLMLAVSVMVVVLAQGIQTQSISGQDIGKTRQRLQELQAQLGQVDGQLEQLRKRRQGVLVELQGITLRVSKARAQAEMAELNLTQIQREAQRLNERKEKINQELIPLKKSLRRQARWLYGLGPLGGLSFFPTYSDIENFLARGRYLEWWKNDETRKVQRVHALHAELLEREKEIVETQELFSKVKIEMAELQEELRANERQLREYLDGIQKDERQQRKMQSEIKEESLMLERMLAGLLSRPKSENAFRTSVSFQSLMGKLQKPVEGTLAEGFGVQTHPRFGTKTVNTGLLIATGSGAIVRAVADGRVVMAESYQSYGLIVILDHGSGYFTLYMHLQAIPVKKGQTVKIGETVGYVGNTSGGPRLGFEIRYQKTPEDPQKWLATKYGAGRNS